MCYKELPAGYEYSHTIDLEKDKKLFRTVQILALILMAIVIGAGCFLVNPIKGWREEESLTRLFATLTLFFGYLFYLVFHELTHGLFLACFTKKKPRFGFAGWAAYCGNEGYCDKPHYLVVALAPLVFFGIAFGVLTVFFHSGMWFWTAWILQAANIGGSAGDIAVSVLIVRAPRDILIQDTGLTMKVYLRKKEKSE